MTNEELVTAIQNGCTDLMETLWNQNKRFINAKAYAWKRAFENIPYFDVDDLEQSAWLALVDAIKYYNPESGCKFLTVYAWFIKRQFQKVIGINSKKRDALFFAQYSLDSPVLEYEPDSDTIGDTIADPSSDTPFGAVEDDSERKQFRSTMDTVASDILTKQQQEVYKALLSDLRCSNMAENKGISVTRIQQQKKRVLEALRNDPRILQLWLDLTNQQETVEDVIDRCMQSVSVRTYRETGISCVERAAMKIIRNKEIYHRKQVALEKALEDKLCAANDFITQEEKKQQRQRMLSELAVFEKGRLRQQSENVSNTERR